MKEKNVYGVLNMEYRDFEKNYHFRWDDSVETKTNREKLDSIPISELEQYLREKKLNNLNK